ncbi:protein kinase [Streptomyces sp. MUM 203J]|uniref:serine/threonine-protein kinase n=1 Tax=Streptomyces sp. MUM 203J TaxID=2791990 RepID=UPI001F046676|nr:serine/threonine-protein kinase [Streptomyces sp. MUM 203J]MCH0540761.1 protein kinase [Streptomyces sp. MUM 203J]
MPPLRSTGPVPEAEHPEERPEPEYAGRYRLGEVLGSGGMGVVRLAASDSGLRLAVKVVHREHAAEPEFRARFRQEVSAARRVSGAFTAPVVDAAPEDLRPWMATLFIDGPTLSERVKRNGPLDGVELRRLGAGLAEALRDIHRAGVVHRDLKPSNVLLAADGPRVIDFGISRPTDSDVRTETGKLIGSPPFMAPEQFQRPREVGPAADVFAMGAVLVHAATGRGPFDSNSPYIVAYQVVHSEPDLAGVPEELVPLLRRCLAKEPGERPTPEELMTALRLEGGAARVPEQRRAVTTAVGKPVREGRRAPVRWWVRHMRVAGAVALALGVAGGVVAVGGTAPGPGAGRSAGPAAEAEPFAPWEVRLEGASAAGGRPPVCVAGGEEALYCAAPGVKAARLRQVDGARQWAVPGGAQGAAGATESAELFVAGGVVFVVSPGVTALDAARLEALDPGSGDVRWGVDLASYAQVVPVDGGVLVVGADGRARALDGTDGAERWSGRPVAGGAQWVAGGDGELLFAAAVAADGASTVVSAVDPGDGTVRWAHRVRGALTPVQTTGGGEGLVLLSADREQFVDAVVRLGTGGRSVRRVPLSAPADQAQATVDGETVYVVGTGGSLAAVDVGPGERELWRFETGAARVSRPVAAGGFVLLSAGDGRLLAVDAGAGTPAGQSAARMGAGGVAAMLPAPVVAGDRVFAAAPDGSVRGVSGTEPAGW